MSDCCASLMSPLVNFQDHNPADQCLPLNHDNGLSSPGSGSLSSDVSSIDYNENPSVKPDTDHLANGTMPTTVSLTAPTVVTNG